MTSFFFSGRVNGRNSLPNLAPRILRDNIQFDASDDSKYARQDPRFDKVAHIFHQNWHGIRAAAGVLPGHKIAIPLHPALRTASIQEVVVKLRQWGTGKIVFHGFSHVAEKLFNVVQREGYECYLVWHGNFAQLAWEPEVHYFTAALSALRKGRFRRAHVMRAGIGDALPCFFAPMLLNSPPVLPAQRLVPAFSAEYATALIGADVDIRKNAHSSLIGASLSKSIDAIFYYGNIKGIEPLLTRCTRIQYRGHDEHLKRLLEIDVVVNASVIDCHPMVGLEALSAGAVDISGPLFLDALGNHPYTKLTTITNPFDVREIAFRLDVIKEIDNSELQSIMVDYARQIASVSISRYCDFLGL